MKFRDETERAAWSSAWDAGRLAGLAPVFCAEGANDKIEAMRERQEPQPPRSERGALARIRAWVKGLGETRVSKETILIHLDAELARQPADELPPKVNAVVDAARKLSGRLIWHPSDTMIELKNAVKALDGGGDE